MSVTILRANALALPLADESVDLIVTSPPYQLDRRNACTDGFEAGLVADSSERIPGESGSPAATTASGGSTRTRWNEADRLSRDLYPHPVQFLCPDEASLKPLGHLTGASGTMPTRRPDRQIGLRNEHLARTRPNVRHIAMPHGLLGRHGVSVDLSQDYCRLAQWRTTDPKQRAKAARVEPVDAPSPDQPDLFGGAA